MDGFVSIARMATDNAGGGHLRLGVRHPGQLDSGGAVTHGVNVSVRRNHFLVDGNAALGTLDAGGFQVQVLDVR